MRYLRAICVLCCLLAGTAVNAGGLLSDLLSEINVLYDTAGVQLDQAHQSLKISTPDYAALEQSISGQNPDINLSIFRAESDKNLEAAQNALTNAEDKLLQANEGLREVAKLTSELEAEKERLEREKQDIERKEQLFSMGFYASLAATAIAVFGLIARLPNTRLEMRLKLLEIEQKEIELANLKEGISQTVPRSQQNTSKLTTAEVSNS